MIPSDGVVGVAALAGCGGANEDGEEDQENVKEGVWEEIETHCVGIDVVGGEVWLVMDVVVSWAELSVY